MKVIQNILGGLAGAFTLNILHETMRRLDEDAPRIDLVGQEALSRVIMAGGLTPPSGAALYVSTLAADVSSNALYYSFIGHGKDENLLIRGAAFGLAAGVGALKLTPALGLDDEPVNRTSKTKVMTVGWYVAGGLAAALVIRMLRKYQQ